VESPSPGSSILTGAAAVTPHNAWAVGVRFGSTGDVLPLALHWTAGSWVRSVLPDIEAFDNLNDVDAIPGLAWAVGGAGGNPLTLRRDASGAWATIPSPAPGEGGSLNGVAVIAADDVWAVGSRTRPHAGSSNLALHWNGVIWKAFPVPSPGFSDGLLGVSAVATDDVWAVGTHGSIASEQVMVAMHWNGTDWRKIKTPNPGTTSFNQLLAVSARSANDVWAVGGGDRVLLLHWDGTSWSRTRPPNIPNLYPAGVVGVAPNDAFAVGYAGTTSALDTVALHWNGSHWIRE
jgi:hypothetical protein